MLVALSFTLAAPVVWEHHYGIALPIFAAALPAVLACPRTPRLHLCVLVLAYALVSNKFDFVRFTALTHWNVVQSYYFFGGLLLLWLLYRLRDWEGSREIPRGGRLESPSPRSDEPAETARSEAQPCVEPSEVLPG